MRRDITGLKVEKAFEDINTYDLDIVIVKGNNRKEIMERIEHLLTEKGIKMYGKLHKWQCQ
jgi:hypothetical protein